MIDACLCLCHCTLATTQSQSQKENPMASCGKCKGTVTRSQASIGLSTQHAAENVSTIITPLGKFHRTATSLVLQGGSVNTVSPTSSVAKPFTSAKTVLKQSVFADTHKRTSDDDLSSEVKREYISGEENDERHNTTGKQSLEAMPVGAPVTPEVSMAMDDFREQLRAAYAAGAEQQQAITPTKTRKSDSCFKSDTLLSSSTSDTDRRTSTFLRRQRNARLHSAPHRKTKTTSESTREPTSSSTCSDSSSTDFVIQRRTSRTCL